MFFFQHVWDFRCRGSSAEDQRIETECGQNKSSQEQNKNLRTGGHLMLVMAYFKRNL